MPSTYPSRSTIRGVDYPTFAELYRRKLDSVGIDVIREQAAEIRRKEGVGDEVPIVFLCFEQLHKGPEQWCHRSVLAAFVRPARRPGGARVRGVAETGDPRSGRSAV